MQKQLFTAAIIASCVAGSTGSALANPPGTTGAVVTTPGATGPVVAQPFGPSARITWNDTRTLPRQVFGLSIATRGATAAERAMNFARDFSGVLGLSGEPVSLDIKTPVLHGARPGVRRTIVRLGQTIGGLVVEGHNLVVTLDEDDRVISVTSDLAPLEVKVGAARVDAAEAARLTEARFEVKALPRNAVRVVLPMFGQGRVAWKVPTAAIPLVAHFFVWVDAEDGAILHTAPVGPHQGLNAIPVRGNP